MSNTSIRQHIIEAIKTRLEIMVAANAFNTDAGNTVEVARYRWESSDIECITVWPRPETASRQYGGETMTMPVRIEIFDKYGTTAAWIKGERILADLREVMNGSLKDVTDDLAEDVIYKGGGVQEFPDSKSIIVGVAADFEIVYNTKIGDPYNNLQTGDPFNQL